MSLHNDCSVHDDSCAEGKPNSCPKEKIRAKRRADKNQGVWGQLVVKREPGGLRHYLDGKPVHCGVGLRLQHTDEKSDDYGEYSVPLQQGTAVRYEASQDSSQIQATLFLYTGGTEFTTEFQPWMRFRWPESR